MLEGRQQFETAINAILQGMLVSERRGDYTEAENLQRRALRLRQKWEADTLAEMERRFQDAMTTLQQTYNQDLEECNTRWTNTLDSHLKSSQQTLEALDIANGQEVTQLRSSMGQQLPSKVKESYQLLNLRQMERHMAKQKDFVQAHLIQNNIRELYAKELSIWNEEKTKKIEQAVINLRAKHAKDRQLFSKRSQAQLEDYNNAWHQQKILIQQRFAKNSKELKAAHQRQIGSFKKQFKTKGGIFSSKFEDVSSLTIFDP